MCRFQISPSCHATVVGKLVCKACWKAADRQKQEELKQLEDGYCANVGCWDWGVTGAHGGFLTFNGKFYCAQHRPRRPSTRSSGARGSADDGGASGGKGGASKGASKGTCGGKDGGKGGGAPKRVGGKGGGDSNRQRSRSRRRTTVAEPTRVAPVPPLSQSPGSAQAYQLLANMFEQFDTLLPSDLLMIAQHCLSEVARRAQVFQ